jgi:hypothetical protein
MTAPSRTEDRLLSLLGNGVSPAIAANSLGITESYVSQLLSREDFLARVTELRFENLQSATNRDHHYDEIEDTLLSRLEDNLPLIQKPQEVLRAIQVINAAKRRGSSVPESIISQSTVINLTIPQTVVNKFSVNPQGQVTSIGDKSLLTIQSGALDSLRKEQQNGSLLSQGSSGTS